MRTTIHLPDALLAQAKKMAAESNRTLTSVIEEALRTLLSRPRPGRQKHAELPTFGDGGTQPGVDLDDSAALLDRLEGPNAAG